MCDQFLEKDKKNIFSSFTPIICLLDLSRYTIIRTITTIR